MIRSYIRIKIAVTAMGGGERMDTEGEIKLDLSGRRNSQGISACCTKCQGRG